MGSVLNLLRKVQALDIKEISRHSIDVNLDHIVKAQQQQMRDGYANDGDAIGDRYENRGYYFYKRGLPTYDPLGGEVDLYRSGVFQNKIVANMVGDEIIIESTDSKADEVTGLWGGAGRIFGLLPEYQRRFVRGPLRSTVISEISKVTGLKSRSL